MELNGKTKVSLSIATLGAILSGAYVFSGDVHEIKTTLAANSASIQQINKQGIARQIADKNSERRNIEAEIRRDPNDPGLLKDWDEVKDEIKALELIQKCMADPSKKGC